MDYTLDYEGNMGGMGGGGHGGAQTPSSTGGNNNNNTQSSGSRKRGSYDEQTVHSVTIKLMMESEPQSSVDSAGLKLRDGRNLHHVQFVASVRSVEDHSTHVMYEMEDGTGGVMHVKQWLDDNQECTAISNLRQQCTQAHVYLKVVGVLKDYDGQKTVLADSIRPLSTSNEITHHFLQVVYQGEMHKRGGNTMGFESFHQQRPGFAGTPQMNRGAPMTNNAGNGVQDDIVRELKSYSGGCRIEEVINVLRGKYSEDQIREGIAYLSSEGTIYSTTDEDTYAVA